MERDFFFNDDEEEKEFLLDNKNLICKLIVSAIEKSIIEDLDKCQVFSTVNSNRNYVITSEVKKGEWDESLKKCLGYFLDTEDYEWCGKIKKLKNKITNG
jgi:hypothetical protein